MKTSIYVGSNKCRHFMELLILITCFVLSFVFHIYVGALYGKRQFNLQSIWYYTANTDID